MAIIKFGIGVGIRVIVRVNVVNVMNGLHVVEVIRRDGKEWVGKELCRKRLLVLTHCEHMLGHVAKCRFLVDDGLERDFALLSAAESLTICCV